MNARVIELVDKESHKMSRAAPPPRPKHVTLETDVHDVVTHADVSGTYADGVMSVVPRLLFTSAHKSMHGARHRTGRKEKAAYTPLILIFAFPELAANARSEHPGQRRLNSRKLCMAKMGGSAGGRAGNLS